MKTRELFEKLGLQYPEGYEGKSAGWQLESVQKPQRNLENYPIASIDTSPVIQQGDVRTESRAPTIEEVTSFMRRDPAMIGVYLAQIKEDGWLDMMNLMHVPVEVVHNRIPENWTALQISFFDNGKASGFGSRGRPKGKGQFALNLRFWCDHKPNFKDAPDFNCNVNLWGADYAEKQLAKLSQSGPIDEDRYLEAMALLSAGLMVGFPMVKGRGTHYMPEWLIGLQLDPLGCILSTPTGNTAVANEDWTDEDVGGSPITKASWTARIARGDDGFGLWATKLLHW